MTGRRGRPRSDRATAQLAHQEDVQCGLDGWPGDIEGATEITYWLDRAVWEVASRPRPWHCSLIWSPSCRYPPAASDNIGSLAVLRKSKLTTIGTEISFAPARGVEIEETILRLG